MEIRSFDEVADGYLKRQAVCGRDVRTLGYQVKILLEHFGGRRIDSITSHDIEAMIAKRLEAGTARSTTNRQRACMSGIFSYALYEGYHPGPNPVRRVRKFRESPGRVRFLSREEACHLVGSAPAHIRSLILFGLYTGGRLRELLGLRRGDLQMFGKPVQGEGGRMIYGLVHFRGENTKGGKYRTVPVCEDLANVIHYMLAGDSLAFLFTYRGKPLRSIRTAFEVARERAGLGRDVVVHTLRHTFCAWATMHGIRTYDLMALAGHSSEAVTRRYQHLSPAHLQQSGAFIHAPEDSHTGD